MENQQVSPRSKISRLKQFISRRHVVTPDTIATATHQSPYVALDDELMDQLPKLDPSIPPAVALQSVRNALHNTMGFDFYEVDEARPWGGFFRIVPDQTAKFLNDFFPGLSEDEARLGHNAEISPKIMLFLPGQRISWQYHHRRTERWHFLTEGDYYRSMHDVLPIPLHAKPGDVVQFEIGERHRGGAPTDAYVLVAEIWQHTNPTNPSNEDDVIRLEDDYDRPKVPGEAKL